MRSFCESLWQSLLPACKHEIEGKFELLLVAKSAQIAIYATLKSMGHPQGLHKVAWSSEEFVRHCQHSVWVPQGAYASHLLKFCSLRAEIQQSNRSSQYSLTLPRHLMNEIKCIGKHRIERKASPESLAADTWKAVVLLEESWGPLHSETLSALFLCAQTLMKMATSPIDYACQYRPDLSSAVRTLMGDSFSGPFTDRLRKQYRAIQSVWYNRSKTEVLQVGLL